MIMRRGRGRQFLMDLQLLAQQLFRGNIQKLEGLFICAVQLVRLLQLQVLPLQAILPDCRLVLMYNKMCRYQLRIRLLVPLLMVQDYAGLTENFIPQRGLQQVKLYL